MVLSRIALVVAALAIAGCSNQGLRDLRTNGQGPDEFLILPSKPLEPPANFAELPEPTPGGANRTDPQPQADAIVALGGRATALNDQGVPSSDAGLVNYASRNGVPGNIRETTAQEDEQFRKRRGRLTSIQLFRTDRYNQVYRPQTLDPFAVERQARRSGVPTPTNPPEFD